MANAENKNEKTELLNRLEAVLERSWSHLTPGTPDFEYAQGVKRQLREAVNPTPAAAPVVEPATTKKAEA